MFDLVFDAFSAFDQIGLLFLATVFLSIGGGILTYELYWRIKAQRVKGVISGVRAISANKMEEDEKELFEGADVKGADVIEDVKSKKSIVGTIFGSAFLLMFIGLPLFFAGMGAYMGYKYLALTKTGEYVQATVVRNEESYDSDSGTSYKAVVSFRDNSGRTWEVKDGISYGSYPSFETGSKVGVYYDYDNPEKFVIDNFWHNMGVSIGFFGFGMGFIGFFVLLIYLAKRNSNKKKAIEGGGATMPAKFGREYYYPVYEYSSPTGERTEHVSAIGISSIIGRIPGKQISLLMFPNDPENVKRPSNMMLIFGLIFILPGAFIMHMAITTYEFNLLSLVLVVIGLSYTAFRIKKAINKLPKEIFKKGWAELKEKGITVTSPSRGDSTNARLLSPAEVAMRLKKNAKASLIAGYVMLFVSLGLSVGAYYASLDMLDMSQNARSVAGRVVNINSRSSSDRGYTYYAVVEFVQANGRKIKFDDSVGASTPMYKVGDDVKVLYKQGSAQKMMVDRGLYNWTLSFGLGAGAVLLLLISLNALGAARRYGGARYRTRM